MTDHDRIEKLPAWARDIIHLQQRQLAEKDAAIAALSAGPEDSNVYVRSYTTPDRLLGRNIEVRFRLPSGDVSVAHDENDPASLTVTSAGSGHDYYPHIIPRVSNSFTLRLGEH